MSQFAGLKTIQAPLGRAGHALLHRQGTPDAILLVGGYNDSGPLADIWMFDLSRNIWSEIMGGFDNRGPLPRVDFDACILGNKLYVFGGMESDGLQALIYNDLWSFNLDSRVWTRLDEEAPVSERMGHVCVALDADHMLVHGGSCLGNVFSDSWLYTASTATWQRIHGDVDTSRMLTGEEECASLRAPYARSSHTACLVPGTGLVGLFGGCALIDGESTHMNDLWLLDTSAGYGNLPAWTWSRKQGSPAAADSLAAAAGGGGRGGQEGEEEGEGEEEAVFPSPRDLPALLPISTSAGPRLIVLGGFGLHEVEEEEEEEEGEEGEEGGMALDPGPQTAAAAAAPGAAAEAAGEGANDDDEVELGYLSDAWCLDLHGVCRELEEAEVTFTVAAASASGGADLSGAAKEETAWALGGAKRGCRLVSTSGGIFSFGGFDGTGFCGELERMDLRIGEA